MRKALKIELHDAGVVLHADYDFEFVGWDYSTTQESYALTSKAIDLLEKMKFLSPEQALEIETQFEDIDILEKIFKRYVSCSKLLAEELEDGRLRIDANAYSSNDAYKNKKEDWNIHASYHGSYTVFWEV